MILLANIVICIGSGYGRIRESLHELVLVMSLLLPGTAIVYYGDEIGMTSGPPREEISFADTRDPYALPPYANESNYHLHSRDPNRTPMQVTNNTQMKSIRFALIFK